MCFHSGTFLLGVQHACFYYARIFFSIVSFNFRPVKKEMIFPPFPLPFSTYGFKIRMELFKDSKRRAGKGEDRAKVSFAIQEGVSSKFCLFKKGSFQFLSLFSSLTPPPPIFFACGFVKSQCRHRPRHVVSASPKFGR